MSETLQWVAMLDESYASDNSYDIPTLDLAWQAHGVIGMFRIWGKSARKSLVPGDTYAFYTWDYAFSALIKHPEAIPLSGCAAIVEPNFSTSPTMPFPVALYGIFLKRKIARYVQTRGIRVIADLEVAPAFADLNLLGLPQGWSSFAQRATRGKPISVLKHQFELACDTLHPTATPYCMVYGGGKAVQTACRKYHWVWIPEHMSAIKKSLKIANAHE